jgi:NAD(P)-dependent dehydrogenase (short-subunit alcohol dehydrogenase family)
MSRKVAFITGASRGIGKWCAIELAAAGYDVAISARTIVPGEEREHSNTLKASDMSPLPGSLETTASLVKNEGVEVMVLAADLLEPASLGAAVAKVLGRFGRIDVVVHCGRYTGPGHMDHFVDTPIDLLRKQMDANLFGPLTIDKLVIPAMIEQGGGTIINITSAAAYGHPKRPAGDGGWGMGYGISKAALQRVSGFLTVELRHKGIRCFNVNPGFTQTDQMAQALKKDYKTLFGMESENKAAPPNVPGKVVRWLCTNPAAERYLGQTLEAQHFCHQHKLLEGWAGPQVSELDVLEFDMSGFQLKQFATELKQ